MVPLFDYLKRQPSFAHSPFNEVDGMVLAELSSIKFQELNFPGTLRELDHAFQWWDILPSRERVSVRLPSYHLLRLAAKSPRFQGIRVVDYVKEVGEDFQFSATAYALPHNPGLTVVFEGTDHSSAGWRENFQLILGEIPSAQRGADYLCQLPQLPLRVVGYSKGGHLASFAAMNGPQDQIEKVFLYDSPGFHRDIFDSEDYERITPKITHLMSHRGVVGHILHHREVRQFVSTGVHTPPMNHLGYTWRISGSRFKRALPDPRALAMGRGINRYLEEASLQERQLAYETVIQLVGREPYIFGTATVSARAFSHALRSYERLQPQERSLLHRLVTTIKEEL
ncbi:MAG: DUF2974 domain-containing protein [Tissierellia bacterium]|nr:DUF2974 domain-containing protein [Tissierellia bacterium]